jgi:hypothetical protein
MSEISNETPADDYLFRSDLIVDPKNYKSLNTYKTPSFNTNEFKNEVQEI